MGNITEFEYRWDTTEIRNSAGDTWQYAFDSNLSDQLQAITNPLNQTRNWTLDTNTWEFTRSVDENDHAITRTLDSKGNITSLTDALGNTTRFDYDPTFNQVTNPLNQVTTYAYDNAGHCVRRTEAGGAVTRYEYDGINNLRRIIDPVGHVTEYAYDSRNFMAFAQRLITAVTNANTNTTLMTYDALGRLVSQTDARGGVTRFEYDAAGRLTAVVDPLNKRIEYIYDELNRLILEHRGELEYRFEYDELGNRTAFVNPHGARMGFGYDALNRCIAVTNALNQIMRYDYYDAAGNLQQRVDANGQTTRFYYDALNRLTNRQSVFENVVFSYDPNGNLTNMVDALGVTSQTFDPMNRLVSTTDPFGQTVSNRYDQAGRRVQLVYPDGKTEQFGYNPADRLTNVLAPSFGLAETRYTYDPNGNWTGTTLPGNLLAAYSYDELDHVSTWSVSNAGSNLLQRCCLRNAIGFKTNESIGVGQEAMAAPTQIRQHNAAGQLTDIYQFEPIATTLPSFDANGNLTQAVHFVRGQTFQTLYRYDTENRLISLTRQRNGPQGQTVTTSVTQLDYDGLGLLLRITDNGIVRRLVRDRADALARPLMETDAAGNPLRRFVWANGRLLAQIESNSTIHVAHCDELGRLLALTDKNGTLTDEYTYQPYGRLIAHRGTTDTPFTWLGAYGVWDAGHGLYLTRYRVYDANLMRFLQFDPIGLAGGWNLYVYAAGNPLAFLDPWGLCAESWDSLSWGQALFQYVSGGGDVSVPISEIYPENGLRSSDFKDSNTLVLDTSGPAGSVTFIINNGMISAANDLFDFDPKPWGVRDPGGFPYLKETSTRIGTFIPGHSYQIHFEGQIPVNKKQK